MGRLLAELGRLDEAEAYGAEAARGVRAKLAPSHPFRIAALARYGKTLVLRERYEAAEVELLESSEWSRRTVGETHSSTRYAIKWLAALYDGWDRAHPGMGYDAKAADWRAKLQAAVDAVSAEGR